MTVVVSDTSPINYLVLIGHIDILPILFGNVLIPIAVHEELGQAGTPPEVRSWASQYPAWLTLKKAIASDPALGLDAGETEAIALAQEVGADLLLMDERKGSKAARMRGLKTAGTLAILEQADIVGLLDFEAALTKLHSTNFHPPTLLLDSMLADARARKKKA